MAWEFQRNGGVELALRPREGLPSRALQKAPGLLVLPGPGLGGARPTALQLTGPSPHLCSLPFRWEHERDLSTPGCPCLWHCPRGGNREGEGDVDSAPAPGSAGELVPSLCGQAWPGWGRAGVLSWHTVVWPPKAGGHSALPRYSGWGQGGARTVLTPPHPAPPPWPPAPQCLSV